MAGRCEDRARDGAPFDWLDAPVTRLAAADVPIPFSKTLEPLTLPGAERLTREAAALVRGKK